MSQFCRRPVVPLAFAAQGAWVMKSWDKFALPIPFSRVVIAVGEPLTVPAGLTAEQMLALQDEMAGHMHSAFRQARAALPQSSSAER